jgi:hypothetical protein
MAMEIDVMGSPSFTGSVWHQTGLEKRRRDASRHAIIFNTRNGFIAGHWYRRPKGAISGLPLLLKNA